jgi:hypothetical protein
MLDSLYRNVNNQSDSELLQKDLTNLENWEKTWLMLFPKKSDIIARGEEEGIRNPWLEKTNCPCIEIKN